MRPCPPYRLLFCLATTALSGGVKMVFEISSGLKARGHSVEIFSFAGPPRWHDLTVPLLASRELEAIDPDRYDFVFVTNAFMVPMFWRRASPARLVFYAQDYESFHHGPSGEYPDFMSESPAIRAVYQLPVPIITESTAVQRLIRERAGRHAWQAPVGLNRSLFAAEPRAARRGPRRVLFVGNYLMPYKGMRDGFDAVNMLARDFDVDVVLATQEDRDRHIFADYPFRTEVHFRPPERAMPAIYASCDVYCCASWYEGLGLPALEAFACGVPVVSTRTFGVDDYGIDESNLLLARAHDPLDLAAKLRRVLTDAALAERLRAGGLATLRGRYDWQDGLDRFEDALRMIADSDPPVPPSETAVSDLLDALEREGCFTPIATFRRYNLLSDQIDRACATLARGPDIACSAELRTIRDELAAQIGNPTTQYYRAFRAKYDLCQLVLGLEEDPRLSAILTTLLGRRQAHAPHASHTLHEIRYLE